MSADFETCPVGTMAEVERLRARLDTHGHRHLDGAHLSGAVDGCLLCDAMAERDRLRAQIAELEQDAKRYRWLRMSHRNDSALCVVVNPIGCYCPSEIELDAAIDAALSKDGA